MPKQKTNALEKADEFLLQLTPQVVKNYINRNATQGEIALFLNQCAMFQLNPFKREIYLIKYKSDQPATFVVGYETYLKRADRTKNWSGMESGTKGTIDGGDLVAWVKIYRKDWENPLYHEVEYEEYVQTRWDNNAKAHVPTRFWKEKPKTMLKKVAISQGMRMAFPDEMGGMPYTSEEMPLEHASLPKEEIIIDANKVKEEDAGTDAVKEAVNKKDPTPKENTKAPTEKQDQTASSPPIEEEEPQTELLQPSLIQEEGDENEEVDGELVAARNAIEQKIELLCNVYGRERKNLLARIHSRIKEAFDVTRKNIPGDLRLKEAVFILDLLNQTIAAEESFTDKQQGQ